MDGAITDLSLYDRHVDVRTGLITCGRESSRLSAQQLRVLLLLARQADLTLSQQQIEKAVWGEVAAGDAVYRCISNLRAALGDHARQPRFIQTVPGQGYRLIAPVRLGPAKPAAESPAQSVPAEPPHDASVAERTAAQAARRQVAGWPSLVMAGAGAALLLAAGLYWRIHEGHRAAAASAKATQLALFMENVFASSQPGLAREHAETAQELLNRAMQRIDADLQEQPRERMQMLEVMGRSYLHQQLGAAALPALQEALRIRQSLGGEPHPQAAATLDALGAALRSVHRFEDARRAHLQALDILRTVGAGQSRDFAATYGQLGTLEVERGRFAEGLRLLETSLRQMRDLQGTHHSDTARILVDIGRACQCSGDIGGASQALHEAQRIYRIATPELNPHRLAAEQAAGQGLLLQQRFDEASIILERTLAARQQLFGPNSIPVAETLDVLGRVRNGQGRLEEAEQLKNHALLALEGLGEAASLQRATIQLSLATLLMRSRQFARSEQLLREAIAVFASTLPADHLSRTSAEHYLGETLLERRKYQEAEVVLSSAIERMQRGHSPQWRIARSRSTLGEVILRQGRTEAGEQLLLESHAQLSGDPDAKQLARAKARHRITTLMARNQS